ncbi:MAG: di-trans,poly-cis-decaprenylcistransferase [Candidatus Solibacter usitatus]|nr:di-trans,poly-cis-decaprenylcistransferase [Candidatus Solibacter usitatus]
MDGNGRWAQARGWPRIAGHKAGAETVRRVVEAAPDLDIGTLTLYAFSSDNWKRPQEEVAALFRLLGRYMRQECAKLQEQGVRFEVIGRRDRLSGPLVALIEQTENATQAGDRLHLRVAVDYSSREAIVAAIAAGARDGRQLCAALGRDVDLLIRTSGEQRLSDFLLWECAYAEFCFTSVAWPDFSAADLRAALEDFRGRERRFGATPPARLQVLR